VQSFTASFTKSLEMEVIFPNVGYCDDNSFFCFALRWKIFFVLVIYIATIHILW